jgi:hypothetical protein
MTCWHKRTPQDIAEELPEKDWNTGTYPEPGEMKYDPIDRTYRGTGYDGSHFTTSDEDIHRNLFDDMKVELDPNQPIGTYNIVSTFDAEANVRAAYNFMQSQINDSSFGMVTPDLLKKYTTGDNAFGNMYVDPKSLHPFNVPDEMISNEKQCDKTEPHRKHLWTKISMASGAKYRYRCLGRRINYDRSPQQTLGVFARLMTDAGRPVPQWLADNLTSQGNPGTLENEEAANWKEADMDAPMSRAQAEAMMRAAGRELERYEKLEAKYGKDDALRQGAVVRFRKRTTAQQLSPNGDPFYLYAAIKVSTGNWFLTGQNNRRSGLSWEQLCGFMEYEGIPVEQADFDLLSPEWEAEKKATAEITTDTNSDAAEGEES